MEVLVDVEARWTRGGAGLTGPDRAGRQQRW